MENLIKPFLLFLTISIFGNFLYSVELSSIHEIEFFRAGVEDALGVEKASYQIEIKNFSGDAYFVGVVFRNGKLVLEAESVDFIDKSKASEYMDGEDDFYIFKPIYFSQSDKKDYSLIIDLFWMDNDLFGAEKFKDFYKIYFHGSTKLSKLSGDYNMVSKYKFSPSFSRVIDSKFRKSQEFLPFVYIASEEIDQFSRSSLKEMIADVEDTIIIFYLVADYSEFIGHLYDQYEVSRDHPYSEGNDYKDKNEIKINELF